MNTRSLLTLLSLVLLAISAAATAQDIPQDRSGVSIVVKETGPVTIYYTGGGALSVNELFLVAPGFQGPIFNNQTSTEGPPPDSLSLGTFDAGTELIFKLTVDEHNGFEFNPPKLPDGVIDFEYFTGPASRNFDNLVHAGISECDMDPFLCSLAKSFLGTPDATLWIGFEDLPNHDSLTNPPYDTEKEPDFNDLRFALSNTTTALIPVPGAVWLLLSALGAAAGLRRRTNRD